MVPIITTRQMADGIFFMMVIEVVMEGKSKVGEDFGRRIRIEEYA